MARYRTAFFPQFRPVPVQLPQEDCALFEIFAERAIMKSIFTFAFCTMASFAGGRLANAGDSDVPAIIRSAIKEIGGEERLGKEKVVTWRAKGIWTTAKRKLKCSSAVVVKSRSQFRIEDEIGVEKVEMEAVTVVDGDKGWRRIGQFISEMDEKELADGKTLINIRVIAATLMPLLGSGFSFESAGESDVKGVRTAGVKIAGDDGSHFVLYFDAKSNLLVKLIVMGSGAAENRVSETFYFSNYKNFDGIKLATKIEYQGQPDSSLDEEIVEFKMVDNVPPETFARP